MSLTVRAWGAAVMTELLVVLTPIGLLDSTSIIPLCIVFLIVLLAGPNPIVRSSGLIFGIFVTYLVFGLLVLFGLQTFIDQIEAYIDRLWVNPNLEELILQIVIGLVLCAVAWRMIAKDKNSVERAAPSSMTAVQAFVSGAVLTIVGLPGAVPYFAAIDLTLRAELTTAEEIGALVFYNVVFVLPIAAIVFLRVVLGNRSQPLLDGIKRFFDTWGQRVIVALLVVLGVVLILDGIGWLLGYPLITV